LELGIKHALKQNTDASKQNIEIGDKMVKWTLRGMWEIPKSTKTWRYNLLHKHYTPHNCGISQHLYFTLLSVTFFNTWHPTVNMDASRENAKRTSSHNTRRETVTGHIPPAHVTDDCKYAKL
jgi:hypothetical protein